MKIVEHLVAASGDPSDIELDFCRCRYSRNRFFRTLSLVGDHFDLGQIRLGEHPDYEVRFLTKLQLQTAKMVILSVEGRKPVVA